MKNEILHGEKILQYKKVVTLKIFPKLQPKFYESIIFLPQTENYESIFQIYIFKKLS